MQLHHLTKSGPAESCILAISGKVKRPAPHVTLFSSRLRLTIRDHTGYANERYTGAPTDMWRPKNRWTSIIPIDRCAETDAQRQMRGELRSPAPRTQHHLLTRCGEVSPGESRAPPADSGDRTERFPSGSPTTARVPPQQLASRWRYRRRGRPQPARQGAQSD